jgi:polar amino acid transport system substrate-binding protein
VVEGVYAVPRESPLTRTADVDRAGVRIAVKRGSAYDLFLTRTLQHAEIVRGDGDVAELLAQGIEVGAGIRQPMTEFVASHADFRLLAERFMQIQQAVGTTRTRQPGTVGFLRAVVDELKADGFVAAALARAGQSPELVAR